MKPHRVERKIGRRSKFCPLHPQGGVRCSDCENVGLSRDQIIKRNNRLRRMKAARARAKIKLTRATFSVNELADVFQSMDKDNSGKLRQTELVDALVKSGSDNKSASKLAQDFFRMNDVDHSGTVSYQEFLADYIRMQMFKSIRVVQAQPTLADANGDGVISKGELYKVLSEQLGHMVARKYINYLFEAMDTDQSGTVTFDEMDRWYLNYETELRASRHVYAAITSVVDKKQVKR